MKIGQYLAKICTRVSASLFLTQSVYTLWRCCLTRCADFCEDSTQWRTSWTVHPASSRQLQQQQQL